jgi:hypothetical protein
MPLSEGPNAMLEYFNQRQIYNFMWEYDGFGMKMWEEYGAYPKLFMQTMDVLAQRSRILYNDGNTVVFSTAEP